MLVLLDNGHGSDTVGKRSPDGRFLEWKFNRKLVKSIHEKLTSLHIANEIIVPELFDVSLYHRVKRVNTIVSTLPSKTDALFLSCHVNAAGNGSHWNKARGWRCYTYEHCSDYSTLLAKCFKDRLLEEYQGIIPMYPGCILNQSKLYVCHHTECPAILTENLFMDNEDDLKLLESDNMLTHLTNLHVHAIQEYIDVGEFDD